MARLTAPSPSPQPSVAVAGLWHLGLVTAACLAEAGASVVAIDPDPEVVAACRRLELPIEEPGLTDLVSSNVEAGRLRFADPGPEAWHGCGIAWIAFDTPVDDEDNADVEWVLERAVGLLAQADTGALVIVSSQLPVGSVAALEQRLRALGRTDLEYACVPENLRLGNAIRTFSSPDRFVAGVRSSAAADRLVELLGRFGPVEVMRVESAEMTKHALNAFLATSIAFINEVAEICEHVGADAAEVARGLKTEARIGPRAYLSPGDAYAGGTLARDVGFLRRLSRSAGLSEGVADGVARRNDEHRAWSQRVLARLLGLERGGPASDRNIAVWGLTYKPGTNTLRRSSALELCGWLTESDVAVQAYDPAIDSLPPDQAQVVLASSPLAAAAGADALVLSTPWPVFRSVSADDLLDVMRGALVIDPGGHLQETLGSAEGIEYVRVGAPGR
jgi:UDPglucose 6-dehydrogenase